nr:MAG TPA: hypothetical protein [Caudoviricetes sp.]
MPCTGYVFLNVQPPNRTFILFLLSAALHQAAREPLEKPLYFLPEN